MSSIDQDNIYIEIQESNYSEIFPIPTETSENVQSNANDMNLLHQNNVQITNEDDDEDPYVELDPLFLQDDTFIVDKTLQYTCYTIKQLLLICEYYGIHKEVKYNKLKKEGIIEQIIWYEMQVDNVDIVNKRRTLWGYMNIIKQDAVLGKFIPYWSLKDM